MINIFKMELTQDKHNDEYQDSTRSRKNEYYQSKIKGSIKPYKDKGKLTHDIEETKSNEDSITQKNKEILLDLLQIEQKKAKKFEVMIEELKKETEEKTRMLQSKAESLKKSNKEINYEDEKEFKSESDEKLYSLCNGLKSFNNELYHKLDDIFNSNEVAKERLKMLDELNYWEKKYNELESSETSKEVQKLRAELDEIKKSTKAYKLQYLNTKGKGADHLSGEEHTDKGYKKNENIYRGLPSDRNAYGVKQVINTKRYNSSGAVSTISSFTISSFTSSFTISSFTISSFISSFTSSFTISSFTISFIISSFTMSSLT